MHKTQICHNYGDLSREWIANIYINKMDIISSLPKQLRSIFDTMIENHMSTNQDDNIESDVDDEKSEYSYPSSSSNNSQEHTDAHPTDDDEDKFINTSSSSSSNMSTDEDMFWTQRSSLMQMQPGKKLTKNC